MDTGIKKTSTHAVFKRIFFIVGGSANGSAEYQADFCTESTRQFSTSSEERRRGLLHPQIPGDRISCFFELSSLQSWIVPVEVDSVWGVFEYRKSNPGGFQVRIGGRERRRVGRSKAEDPGEDLHRGEQRQR